MIDLHTHTTASDGVLRPAELVRLACQKGLHALAITDHDTVGGVDEALSAAAATSLTVLPGVELSAALERGTLHLVGLYVDHRDAAFLAGLGRVMTMRDQRNPRIVARLRALGIDIEMSEVAAEAQGAQSVGRPHFARLLVKKRIVPDVHTAFSKYLGVGGLAEIPKERLAPAAAIALIVAAGGIPILAHPAQTRRSGRELERRVKDLVDVGLAGIEVSCPGHDSGTRGAYEKLARQFGLLRSGGSDFHDFSRNGNRLGYGSAGAKIPDVFFQEISEYRARIVGQGR